MQPASQPVSQSADRTSQAEQKWIAVSWKSPPLLRGARTLQTHEEIDPSGRDLQLRWRRGHIIALEQYVEVEGSPVKLHVSKGSSLRGVTSVVPQRALRETAPLKAAQMDVATCTLPACQSQFDGSIPQRPLCPQQQPLRANQCNDRKDSHSLWGRNVKFWKPPPPTHTQSLLLCV